MPDCLPVLFLSHGSPLNALEPDSLAALWSRLGATLPTPRAVLLASAHWCTDVPVLGACAEPATLHDFHGFPEALYRLAYPAPGAPELALRARALLGAAGILAGLDASRGLDHGAWVPLRWLFPAASVPVAPLSVQPARDARHHLALGRALQPLRREGVLIVASGHLTHNLGDWAQGGRAQPHRDSVAFRAWVDARLRAGDTARLAAWEDEAPGARHAHPSPEHFLPLLVALGAAGGDARIEALGGGWIARALAADHYRWDGGAWPESPAPA